MENETKRRARVIAKKHNERETKMITKYTQISKQIHNNNNVFQMSENYVDDKTLAKLGNRETL